MLQNCQILLRTFTYKRYMYVACIIIIGIWEGGGVEWWTKFSPEKMGSWNNPVKMKSLIQFQVLPFESKKQSFKIYRLLLKAIAKFKKSCLVKRTCIYFAGTDVGVLIKLTENLHKDLLDGKKFYQNVFIKMLDIDYLSYVIVILEKQLANDAHATMKKANMLMANIESKVTGFIYFCFGIFFFFFFTSLSQVI